MGLVQQAEGRRDPKPLEGETEEFVNPSPLNEDDILTGADLPRLDFDDNGEGEEIALFDKPVREKVGLFGRIRRLLRKIMGR